MQHHCHRINRPVWFTTLILVAGMFACGDGETEPEPIPNRAPTTVGALPSLSLIEAQSETVDVASFFTDPDGDNLTYSAVSSDNAVVTVSVSGSNVAATGVAEGTAAVTVTATDPGGLSATQSFTVTVAAANEAPEVADTIPDQELTAGDTLTVDVSGGFSDPDGDTLAYAAESGDTAAAAVTVDGSVVTIIARAAGSAAVTVTATDPGVGHAVVHRHGGGGQRGAGGRGHDSGPGAHRGRHADRGCVGRLQRPGRRHAGLRGRERRHRRGGGHGRRLGRDDHRARGGHGRCDGHGHGSRRTLGHAVVHRHGGGGQRGAGGRGHDWTRSSPRATR